MMSKKEYNKLKETISNIEDAQELIVDVVGLNQAYIDMRKLLLKLNDDKVRYEYNYNRPIRELLKPYNVKIEQLLQDRKIVVLNKDKEGIDRNSTDLYNIRKEKKKILNKLIG